MATSLASCKDRVEPAPTTAVTTSGKAITATNAGASRVAAAASVGASSESAQTAPPSLVDLLPADGSHGVRRIVRRAEKDHVEAVFDRDGRSVAVVTIDRVDAAERARFANARERLNGHALSISPDATELLAAPSTRVRVTGRDLDAAARREWLGRVDLGGLVVEAQR